MYPMHWACTGRFDDVWPARNNGLFVDEGTEWAEQCAIGCIKITAEARIAPLEKAHWSRLEISVENATKRPVHLHWPGLKHHHW